MYLMIDSLKNKKSQFAWVSVKRRLIGFFPERFEKDEQYVGWMERIDFLVIVFRAEKDFNSILIIMNIFIYWNDSLLYISFWKNFAKNSIMSPTSFNRFQT